ncbi:hypothetical protein PT974_12155 [Cladobotryum mycophilum]|uniref:Uncharacterized protein n=1 Tax=Cladobotryum mycophilum TaxID=491253 RepID=A0ABR0S779_9HYPO
MRFVLASLLAVSIFVASTTGFFFFPLRIRRPIFRPIPIVIGGGGGGGGGGGSGTNNCAICPPPTNQAPNCPKNAAFDRRSRDLASCTGGRVAYFNADGSLNVCQ